MTDGSVRPALVAVVALLLTAAASAQTLSGTVRDASGSALPGVSVELRRGADPARLAVTSGRGVYRFDGVPSGPAHVSFTLINFGVARRDVTIPGRGSLRLDVTLQLSLTADVAVTGKASFTNIADAADPAGNLVGIAQSASQGAITARQLDARPIMRSGEVLETVPGVIISQHSGEGKANQYYLRGFNLDHGTDFATTLAGMPVNMPTHGHGQGYSDLNVLIPELVSGVQYSKGPYFADQGDFATAGAANINYASTLDRPIVSVEGGGEGFGRVLAAASPRVGQGHLLAALEIGHDDGPWTRPDRSKKVNGVVRYGRGDALNGISLTVMGYDASWDSTDQIPRRAVASGLVGRFGAVDPSDGGTTSRYSGSLEWQRTRGNASTRVTAYGIGYDLRLFSDFTYFLADPLHGDQLEQTDHRFVSGAKASYRRIDRWNGRSVQNTVGVQVRNDDIGNVGLYHTEARRRLSTTSEASVVETSGAAYAQNDVAWMPWLRTTVGLRADAYRFAVTALEPDNSGITDAGIVSPKGGVAIGPFRGTELYANAGAGFHSNDARVATFTRDPAGAAVTPASPLVRAVGVEGGVRTVAIPHLQSSLSVWTLGLASELVFAGDAGTTEAGRPSRRYGVEWANYYHPRPWLVCDGDLSISRGHFTTADPAGDYIPGSVEGVASVGATVDGLRRWYGSARLRYFGPRPLIEDNTVRSQATTLVNLDAGYEIGKKVRLAVNVFNLFDAADSDIDYYYTSRLPGEPAGGVMDVHFHPTLPRTARVSLVIGR